MTFVNKTPLFNNYSISFGDMPDLVGYFDSNT